MQEFKKKKKKKKKKRSGKKKKKEKMLLGTLGASLLGNLLGIVRTGSRNKKGKEIVRAGTGKDWDF